MRKFLLILALLVLLERGLALYIHWFEVKPIIVVLHFVVVLGIVGWVASGGKRGRQTEVVLVFVFASLFLGAWTSAHIGAAEACQGFPLCNGSLLPTREHLVRMHWAHRIASYATFFVVFFYSVKSWRRNSPRIVRNSAVSAAIIVTLEALLGVAVVTQQLPRWMQGTHLALGVLLWAVVVVWWRSTGIYYSS